MRNKKTARKMKVENHSLTHLSNNSQSIVQNKTDTKNEHISYTTIIKENQLFERYYRQLNLIHESEFEDFMNTLKRPLPITFRITSYKCYANELLRVLKEKHFKYLDDIVKEDGGELVKSGNNKLNINFYMK